MNVAILLLSLGSMWLVARLSARARFRKIFDGYFGLCAQSMFGYAVFFLSFYFYEWHFRSVLEEFDLNNNGIFDSTEISSEQVAALDAYINDAGRNIFKIMAPILFAFIAAFRVLLLWLAGRKRGR